MPALNTHPAAVEARRIAKAAGLIVFEKPHHGGTLWRVVRRLSDGRVAHLGTRATPESLKTYVARLAAVH